MKVMGILLLLMASADAGEAKLPPGITCTDVRARVAEYGKYVAYAWARLHGYSKHEIREAEKCLR